MSRAQRAADLRCGSGPDGHLGDALVHCLPRRMDFSPFVEDEWMRGGHHGEVDATVRPRGFKWF